MSKKQNFLLFQCGRCLPLYNDKPFRPGDQVHAYNCKPCQCYGHAESCHYDLAMDPFPQEHHRGGGGVCDNCQHNTAGKSERMDCLFYSSFLTLLCQLKLVMLNG